MCLRLAQSITKCNRLSKVALYVWAVIEKFITKTGSVNGSIYRVSEYTLFIKLDPISLRHLHGTD